MYILKNDHLQIGIQHNGAELCSIKNLKNNKEYMWQADPEIWGSHAPNLFPVIGALNLSVLINRRSRVVNSVFPLSACA